MGCVSEPVKQCENIPNSNKRNVARTVCDTVVDSHEVEDCTETITEVWESLCCKSNVPQITKKNTKELKTNKKAQETKTRPHLLSDRYYQLLWLLKIVQRLDVL